MEPLKDKFKTQSQVESPNANMPLPLGISPQTLLESAAIFNDHLGGSQGSPFGGSQSSLFGGSQGSPSKQLGATEIAKAGGDLSLDISRLSNEISMNGQSAAFSIFMPRLGRVDVRTHHTNTSLMLQMKTDSRPFRNKLKANKEKIERSVSRSTGKKTRISILDDE